ncbi:hypothetical protein ASE14_13880 [Agromyces sp. Root81]|uniref:hypothetical protein n=1 Tax=Agromyces sp. Root81 TaxID=1736601 RepID=UPI0006FCB33D|nr:hypothetical protein [Agromyces sp. Root81]KRC61876.1 hypothetical protein ASE14_13880 [Agromyces sp. Root81]
MTTVLSYSTSTPRPTPTGHLAGLEHWPRHTTATDDDIVVSGVSMLRLVELCGTPCVHTATAEATEDGGPGRQVDISVVVVRVTNVRGRGAERVVEVDGRLDGCDACWFELRMIGRACTGPTSAVGLLTPSEPGSGNQVSLPADIAAGDLIAVPCGHVSALRDIRRG